MNRCARRTAPGRRTRRVTLFALAAFAGLVSAAGPVDATPATRPAAAPIASSARATGVSIQVEKMSPSAPARTERSRPLSVTLSLTNTTGAAIDDVSIEGVRGDPVTSQSNLDTVAGDATPTPDGLDIEPTEPVTLDLPADGIGHTVTFRTTYGVPTGSGVCQCADGVYPLYFSAVRATSSGGSTVLDTTVTFLPSFLSEPEPVRVAWVWPLLDRPHRLSSSSTFLDDALATEVADGGRLDRSLAAVEQVAGRVPVTLVVDPDLLDELEVMSTGRYSVRAGTSSPAVAGTGQDAALAWLARFTTLLDTHPGVRVALTPFADPDIPSLTLDGIAWQSRLPTDMRTRVARALGTRAADFSLAWPASGAYTARSLSAVVGTGVTSVLLPSTAVTPPDGNDGASVSGLARLKSSGDQVSVGLLSSAAQADVAVSVARTASGADRLAQLQAEIAVRAAAQPDGQHTLVLAAPRYVDADPDRAADVMRATSDSPFARRISLTSALATDRLPGATSRLATFRSSTPTLAAHLISPVSDVDAQLPAVRSMLQVQGQTATTLAASFPVARQRVTSSYWLAHPATGTALAQRLHAQIEVLTGGRYVYIVPPFSGSYTLASENSPLPVTVRNRLPYPVGVRVLVRTVNGQPGFTVPKDLGTVRIDAASRSILRLPTSIARSGRIQIEVQLIAPQGHTIGESVPLTVHSTAFGVIGVVITVVAGVVLALALLVRLVRQLRRRRRARGTRRPPAQRPAEPEPAA